MLSGNINYADAGKRVLTAHDIKIAGPNVENYQLRVNECKLLWFD